MDSDCVNDISKATNSPQKKKQRLPEQHFLPAYTAGWPAVVRLKLDQFHAYANVTFRFALAMAWAWPWSHGGRFDKQRHLKTAKHLSYKVSIESTQLIGEFLNMVNVKYSKILAT